jgi:hypothetical protein
VPLLCLMAVPRTYTDTEAAAALRSDPGLLQSSPDPFEATQQTVEYMCKLVHDSLADGIVQRATVDADRFRQFGPHPWASLWWFAKHRVKFVHHQKLLVAWLNAPDELQLLIRPDALLKMEDPKGDCAVFTTLICAMLDCCQLPWEIVTLAVDPNQPGIFSHVYPRVILPSGLRVPLDASHGKFPGWEVPRQHVSAIQIWDMQGQPIEDQAPGQFAGLHGVDMRYLYGGSDRRGLGQDDSGDGTDSEGLPVDQSPIAVNTTDVGILPINVPTDLPAYTCADGAVVTQASFCAENMPSAGGGGSAAITSASGATLSAAQLAAILQGANTAAVGVAKAVSGQPAAGTLNISSTTLRWLAGGAVVLVLLFSLGGKR